MAFDGQASAIRTACPYCGVGCGVVGQAEGRALTVEGDKAHPANFGRLCSKGSALGRTVGLEGRLLAPMIGTKRVTWTEATAHVAKRLSDTFARHGPDSVAFYVSGQLLTEDYYAANKLMKGFIGSGNIDTNSRLCMASAVVAHKLAFGADLVPGCYEDLELADLVVFAGHNAAWTHPVLFRRMEQARARGQAQVVIDPRRTDTAETADLHLALKPQTDVRLWNGLLADLLRRGAVDRGYVAAHVAGFDEVLAQLQRDDQSVHAVAADCGLVAADLERFFELFAATPRTVSLFSMGANQSTQGVAKGSAIINAHLATGRIGKPGACPFSITGQPNAMGGRETGGMATTLAGHMDFDEASRARVARFWGAERLAKAPGLKAIDMFRAVADGKIKAIWIMATNPVVSLPEAETVRAALARCPTVIVSDCMAETDTMAFAHVKLPALAWGEKDGTVTNSERLISRQRPLMRPPGEARADWRIIAEVAAGMGFGEAFDWRSPASVFREWARLTAYENDGRVLNLGPLAGLTPAAYDALAPVQWPVTEAGGTARLFADGRFQTPDGKARMLPVAPTGPAEPVDAAFPLALNTGRVRDHWHTMTRTGLAPELCQHAPEPYVEIHPDDAAAAGVTDGALTRVQTRHAEAVVKAVISDRQRPGAVFMPMHWTAAFAPAGRANRLVAAKLDARSGQPEFKHTPARVRLYRETWRGFLIAAEGWAAPERTELVWRRIPQVGCQLHEFAGRGDEAERDRVRKALTRGAGGEALRYEDAASGSLREAYLENGRLIRVYFATREGRLPPRDWLVELFTAGELDAVARSALLIGRAPGRAVQSAPIVCACLGIRADKIEAAIAAGAGTLEAVSEVTRAATNCGSCRPEIARMIAKLKPEAPPMPHEPVQLVGAGPGAADLLTLRAARAIAQAEALLYDALVSDEVLALAPAACLKIQTGKRGGRPSLKQSTINRLMLRLARRGLRVVRLKGGDPSIFGRVGEEAQFLQAHGVDTEVVPGVTAASAAAAQFGFPLTHRGEARRLVLTTARLTDGVSGDWAAAADLEATLAIYMGAQEAAAVTSRLIAAGRPGATPVIIVERAGSPDARCARGALTDLVALVASLGEGPILIVVGEVTAKGLAAALERAA